MSWTPLIKTPETDPDHEVIGQIFKGPFGEHLYYCDSWQENAGYWMTRVDAPEENKADQHSEWRRNVSEMAIGRTFHVKHNAHYLLGLNKVQQDHVLGAFPETRTRIADCLKRGAEVIVYKQNECGPDVQPFAVAPQDDHDFWLGCWETAEIAAARATDLGLKVVLA